MLGCPPLLRIVVGLFKVLPSTNFEPCAVKWKTGLLQERTKFVPDAIGKDARMEPSRLIQHGLIERNLSPIHRESRFTCTKPLHLGILLLAHGDLTDS
jgi:hypothetical protein